MNLSVPKKQFFFKCFANCPFYMNCVENLSKDYRQTVTCSKQNMPNYRKYYSNWRGIFRNISNCLKNCFIKITQQINFLRFKHALWSGPYCIFCPKMPNRCTKNEQFAKHLKKIFFFGPKNSKIDISKNINTILKKNTCPFLSSIERGKKIPAQSKIWL